jgi:hypothetical protein
VWGTNLKFIGLNLSINIVDALMRDSQLVEKVEEGEEEDKGEDEGTKHKCESQGASF